MRMNAVFKVDDAPSPGNESKLAPGLVDEQYTTTLTASGGSGNYEWELSSPPAMPSGLNLDARTGVISGLPDQLAEGTAQLTFRVTDANANVSADRTFFLTVYPPVRISKDIERKGSKTLQLKATGGSESYTWKKVNFPDWLELDSDKGTVRILDDLRSIATTQFTVRAIDMVSTSNFNDASFSIMVRPAPWWRRQPGISGLNIKVRPKRGWARGQLGHTTTWIGIFALVVPILGAIWITIYAFTTSGPHGTYLSVGLLTALAAFMIGDLAGFLFGIPRVVSSGQVRQKQSSEYAPSSNLAEVSDWLTKLLLGAGLVQLTRLGAPIADLIDHVAAGLHTTSDSSGAATVMAGAIIFGYTAIGLLGGYVVTTMWYQRRLAKINP